MKISKIDWIVDGAGTVLATHSAIAIKVSDTDETVQNIDKGVIKGMLVAIALIHGMLIEKCHYESSYHLAADMIAEYCHCEYGIELDDLENITFNDKTTIRLRRKTLSSSQEKGNDSEESESNQHD